MNYIDRIDDVGAIECLGYNNQWSCSIARSHVDWANGEFTDHDTFDEVEITERAFDSGFTNAVKLTSEGSKQVKMNPSNGFGGVSCLVKRANDYRALKCDATEEIADVELDRV